MCIPHRPTSWFGNFICTVALARDKKSKAEEEWRHTKILIFGFIYLFIFILLLLQSFEVSTQTKELNKDIQDSL